jgi:hypothetical protein
MLFFFFFLVLVDKGKMSVTLFEWEVLVFYSVYCTEGK